MKTARLLFIVAILASASLVVGQEPLTWTTQQDHQNMKDQLGIKTLRPGRVETPRLERRTPRTTIP